MAAHILLATNSGGGWVDNPDGPNRSIVAKKGDLVRGTYDHVLIEEVPTAYEWQVVYAPLSPDGTASSVSTGTDPNPSYVFGPLDNDGAYLLRLTLSYAASPDSIQYVRVRVASHFGDMRYVAAGERYDNTGRIPADILPDGWTNSENQVLQRLNALMRRASTSGCVLYVDANRGRDKDQDQDDPENTIRMPGWDEQESGGGWSGERTGIEIPATHFGDFTSIQRAINWAASRNPPPSVDNPWFIMIQPGYYAENLEFAPNVHLVGLGGPVVAFPTSIFGNMAGPALPTVPLWNASPVMIDTVGADPGHVYPPSGPDDVLMLSNLLFINNIVTSQVTVDLTGALVLMERCTICQMADDPDGNQGGALAFEPFGLGILFGTNLQIYDTVGHNTSGAAVKIGSPGAQVLVQFFDTIVMGGVDALHFNPDNETDIGTLNLNRVTLSPGLHYALRATTGEVNAKNTEFTSHEGDAPSVALGPTEDTDGLLDFSAIGCTINGGMECDTSHITGSPDNRINLGTGSCYLRTLTFTGDPVRFQWYADTDATTIRYVPDYVDPVTGDPTVSPGHELVALNVQAAIDELANRDSGGSGARSYHSTTLLDYTIGTTGSLEGDHIEGERHNIGAPGTRTIRLPLKSGRTAGDRVTVKDELGLANPIGGQPIVIYPHSTDIGTTIDGSGSYTITAAYGSVTFYYNGNNWSVM